MSKPRVLIVDDSEIVLETLPTVLSPHFGVETCSNPMLIASILRREGFDLLLLDVDMPALSGPQAVSALRRSDCLESTQIVLYSGRPAEELKELAASCGAAGSLPKDTPHSELASALMGVLRRSRTGTFSRPSTSRPKALVFAEARLESQLLDQLQKAGFTPEPRGVLGVDRALRSSDARAIVLEAAAFEDLPTILARLRRRQYLEGKNVLVVGDCPGEQTLPPEGLTPHALSTALAPSS